jgi:hypothetical protein
MNENEKSNNEIGKTYVVESIEKEIDRGHDSRQYRLQGRANLNYQNLYKISNYGEQTVKKFS